MELESTRIFVKVAQLGSFTKAADLLKLPKSTVSRTVRRLEEESGTHLLRRTTRSLTLTAPGQAFYDACLAPLQKLEEARKSLHGQDSLLSGKVRLTAPDDLGNHVLAPALAELTRQNPGLAFELVCTDQVIDLVKEGFDMAVRIGRLNDSSFRARRLGASNLVLVASPRYLKGKKIKHPNDLREVDALTYAFKQSQPRWTLKSKRETVHVPLLVRVSGNQMTSLVQMALNDGGVALVPHYLCRPHIESGALIHLLPEWSDSAFPVHLVMPQASQSSTRLKVAAEYLAQAVANTL